MQSSCCYCRVYEEGTGGNQQEVSLDGRAEWTTAGSDRRVYVDPKNPIHQSWLLMWCKAHWMSTFRRSLMYGNKLTYHICCNCFSRRSFARQAGHPQLLSIGVLQITGLRNASTHEDLFNWLIDVITEKVKQGHKVLFPALNRHHDDREESDESVCQDNQEQDGLLAKRNQELESQLNKTLKQLQDLKKDNERLLKSSCNWHQRYEELVDSDNVMALMATPCKYKVIKGGEINED